MTHNQKAPLSAVNAMAPGSLMIAGEHAVLRNYHAVVGSIDKFVRVSLKPLAIPNIEIESTLGSVRYARADFDVQLPFSFVSQAILLYEPEFPLGCGVRLEIESELSTQTGVGSSAAVTIAALAALHASVAGTPAAPEYLWRRGLEVVRAIQGTGSGADLAAAAYGGILLYRQNEGVLLRKLTLHPLTLVYAGYKRRTAEVIEIVNAAAANDPDHFDQCFRGMDRLAVDVMHAWDHDEARLFKNIQLLQGLMGDIGVCDDVLADIVACLRAQPGVKAAKISGSGLGDCVLGMGALSDSSAIPYAQIPVAFGNQGVSVEITTN